MNERRAKGWCYFCEEPYTHKKLQIHLLEVDDTDDKETESDQRKDTETEQFDEPHISVNALMGVTNFRTMTVTGRHKRKPLDILIGSGGTHNFLNVHMEKKIDCKIEELKPLMVTVADGTKVQIASNCCKEF